MQKTVHVDGIDSDIIISKRKGTRNIRLSIGQHGKIRLSVPYFATEKQALKFLDSKKDWIIKHQKPQIIIKHGDHIGKSHRVVLRQGGGSRYSTSISNNEIKVSIPDINIPEDDKKLQTAIKRACEKALKNEAEILLPQRLETLARKHGFRYTSCTVKKLKSRWGSCDSRNNIVLNIYLIQLDWRLIDYVILHELTHTEHKHHQSDFWDALEDILPNTKNLRKELKNKPTDAISTTY